jgi:hypothetical protein
MSLFTPRHLLVDRHFDALNSAGDDGRMWRHLAGCERCRVRYRGRSLLELLDADGSLARTRERLGRTLFASRRPPRERGLRAGAALSAVLLLVVFWPSTRDVFQARGTERTTQSSEQPSVTLFQMQRAQKPERVGTLLRHDAALAIAYRNPGPRPFSYLMVFATDAQRRIYWFAPLWRHAADNPRALAVASGDAQHELNQAVRHALPAGKLELVVLFSRKPYTVREIEARLQRQADALAELPDVQIDRRMLEVKR